MGSLQAQVQPGAQSQPTRVILSGAIDERCELDEALGGLAESEPIELDLAGISRINSIGVMRWITALEALCKGRDVRVVRASYVVINQANSVANFFADAQVRSCLVPYFCPACGDNKMLEIEVDEVRAAGCSAPARRCDSDDAQLEFDELDSYFTFARE